MRGKNFLKELFRSIDWNDAEEDARIERAADDLLARMMGDHLELQRDRERLGMSPEQTLQSLRDEMGCAIEDCAAYRAIALYLEARAGAARSRPESCAKEASTTTDRFQ